MRVAIYGGSFNPPHNGHVQAARAAVKQLSPDALLFIPAYLPPHKALDKDSPDAWVRLTMAQLMAYECFPAAQASDIEIRRGEISYTVDTLEEFLGRYPGTECYLLLGSDMFLSFETWYKFERIFELCTLAPFARHAGEDAELAAHALRLKERYGARVELIANDPLDISSTELRAALKRGEGSDLLPRSVYGYIIAKRLYGAIPDLDWLREEVYARLDAKRAAHVRGTEEEAVKLAKRWGAAERPAAEAGILHDITKQLSVQEQLLLCERYGIINDTVELQSPKLLHAKTGAELARERFGAGSEVAEAIRWHTTGRADMRLLEKILYLADYIEPTRDFEGVDELRRLAYTDLNGAMTLALQMSLAEVRAKGSAPHEKTEEALDFLRPMRKEGTL
ncbi:MAG: nicotinate (nicotinamide) nucleotide adenylyltransferase [Firmicutes bacterium]|nr:nicotinate (nicotinamide) nucleotide adenylyltransferase [Bacillota bacterium]